jgi:hypothetical protein
MCSCSAAGGLPELTPEQYAAIASTMPGGGRPASATAEAKDAAQAALATAKLALATAQAAEATAAAALEAATPRSRDEVALG